MLRLTLPARLSAHSDSARAAETAAATALTRDAEGVAEQRLRRQRTESYHDPWLQTRQLGCKGTLPRKSYLKCLAVRRSTQSGHRRHRRSGSPHVGVLA
jgi:hypothetical protein